MARYSERSFWPVDQRGSFVLPVASSLMALGAMPVFVEMSAWLSPNEVMSEMSCFQSMTSIVRCSEHSSQSLQRTVF